jgi:hypothetical protein
VSGERIQKNSFVLIRLRIGLLSLSLSVGKLIIFTFFFPFFFHYIIYIHLLSNSPDYTIIGQSGQVNAFQLPTTTLVALPSSSPTGTGSLSRLPTSTSTSQPAHSYVVILKLHHNFNYLLSSNAVRLVQQLRNLMRKHLVLSIHI